MNKLMDADDDENTNIQALYESLNP